MKIRNKTLVIAGGGTGGHIYPGLALADFLKKKDPKWQIHFVGAYGGLEEKIIPQYGYPLHLLKVGKLHKSIGFLKRIISAFLLPLCFLQSLFLFFKIRPQFVLGLGGFASGPFVFTASLFRVRTALFEPNVTPGLTNRILSKVVTLCFVVFDKSSSCFPQKKVHVVGLPVRIRKQKAQMDPNLRQRAFRILIFGGSQGARGINNIVGRWIKELGDQGKNYEIFHQIGFRDFEFWKAEYSSRKNSFLKYSDYIQDMPEKLRWADLVICRAGIGTVIEVAMSGKPALFIPLPTSADNHQFENAKTLVDQEASFMIEEKNLTWRKLYHFIEDLRNKPEKLEQKINNLKKIDHSTACQQVLNILCEPLD